MRVVTKKQNRQENRILKSFFLMCMVCTMFALTGCGAQDLDEDEDIVIEQFEPLSAVVEGQKNVYVIMKAKDNNYWDNFRTIMKKAGEEQHCNIYCSGSINESQWEAQVELIDMAKEAKADAIIIAPDDSASLAIPISSVYADGIPVVLIDTTLTTDDYDICYMTDNLVAGQNAAEEMVKRLYAQGYTDADEVKVAIQVGSTYSQTINERLAGFCKYWTNHAPLNWKIIDDVKVNGGNMDVAVDCAKQLLDTYPDIKGVFGCNNGSTVGFARELLLQERTDIVIVGFDYSEEMANLIADSSYNAATMLQRQDLMGNWAVQSALELIAGKEMESKFVDTGVIVVNDETVNSEEVQGVINLGK